MKQKVKLAEDDCARLHTGNYSSDSSMTTARVAYSFTQGYLAGFEKAREMALTTLPMHFHGEDGYVGLNYLKNLGEEEV